jgi:hypothetical protein
MKRSPLLFLALLTLAAGLPFVRAEEVDPFDQSKVPLEVQPNDPGLTKIVLVAGKRSHGPGDHEFFAGCAILMNLLKQTPGVFPVMARDGWPKDPEKTFAGAKAVVFYMDGGGGHPIIQKDHKDVVARLMEKKIGFVNLHYAVEYPKNQSDHILNWLGGYYETGFSTNPHWVANFKKMPEHPITRGVKPFSVKDEWYFNMRFRPDMKGVTPILSAKPGDEVRKGPYASPRGPYQHIIDASGRSEALMWATERIDGGRGVGFTGGHYHENWLNDDFRKAVLNALLWITKLDVPRNGVESKVTTEEIKENLDKKGK